MRYHLGTVAFGGLVIAVGFVPGNPFKMDAAAHAVDNVGTVKLIDAAKAKLSEKFKDDEKEIQAEFCAEIGFGLHNLIGTTQPATGGPDPYGGPPQFTPPPNFAP